VRQQRSNLLGEKFIFLPFFILTQYDSSCQARISLNAALDAGFSLSPVGVYDIY